MTLNVVVDEQTDEKLAAIQGGGQMNALGFSVEPLSPLTAQELGLPKDEKGIVVASVHPQSPVAEGLQPGYLIVSVNGQKVTTPEEFNVALEKATLPLRIEIFDGKERQKLLIAR